MIMNITVGSIVRSTAGKDKDRFAIVVKLEGGRAFVSDGKYRKLTSPKPKNIRHLAPTSAVFPLPVTDKQLRRLLNTFGGNTKED